MKAVYIAGGGRTPIGKTGGILKDLLPEQLAAGVLNEIIKRNGIADTDIDQVILGNVIGTGGNIARVSVLQAGWDYSIPAVTIDSQCGSGLTALSLAAGQIMSGQADLVIAGGAESTSLAPSRRFNARDPRFEGDDVFYERAPFSTANIGDPDMGEGAERLAGLMGISRKEMDLLALESHQRASNCRNEGILQDVILPLEINGETVSGDECIRPGMNLKLLERMPPVFVKGGSVTAGNTCLKHDGAAMVLLASEKAVEKYGLKPDAHITEMAACGCDPNIFPLSPVFAIRSLLKKADINLENIDALEINEAFAVKVIACCKELGLSPEKTNILGGALAYGHPYGASGAIIVLHLLKALKKTDGKLGIAAIGAVGGMGTAMLLERCR